MAAFASLDIFPAEHADGGARLPSSTTRSSSCNCLIRPPTTSKQKIGRFTVFPRFALRCAALQRAQGGGQDQGRAAPAEAVFIDQMKLIEAQRIEQRTGSIWKCWPRLACKGIENYSRHMSGPQAGEPPPTLIDYLPRNSLMFIDESRM